MKNGKLPFVIAIAAVSGGGKTTIAKHLSDRLKNANTFYFDDYHFEPPGSLIDWIENGANYDAWNLAPLIKEIQASLSEPLDYIVIDFPFAYKHSKMSKFIDFAVFIDTPLDIAMARRVMRDFNNSSVEHILLEMQNYLLHGRHGYLEMLKTIKPNSDIIVDGSLPVSEIVNIISQNIKK